MEHNKPKPYTESPLMDGWEIRDTISAVEKIHTMGFGFNPDLLVRMKGTRLVLSFKSMDDTIGGIIDLQHEFDLFDKDYEKFQISHCNETCTDVESFGLENVGYGNWYMSGKGLYEDVDQNTTEQHFSAEESLTLMNSYLEIYAQGVLELLHPDSPTPA